MFFNFQITLSTVLWFDLAWVQLYVALLQATVKAVPDIRYKCNVMQKKLIFF